MAWRTANTRRSGVSELPYRPEPHDANHDVTALQDVALRLDYMIGQVTPAEFHWQDATYDRDSVLGRELLFLIANEDWIRATSEVVDIDRSDAIETTIDIDIDLSRITHEAFRDWTGQIWLPIVVLPPLLQRLLDPEPFSTLTVMDGSGSPLMTLPRADVRHRVAAALTDIILNVAASRLPDLVAGAEGFNANRDHQLLLSAAIYRLLRGETVPEPVLERKVAARQVHREPMPRIDRVRNQVGELLGPFSGLLAKKLPADQPSKSAARQLTERALQLLSAFTDSAIVVIAAEREHTPTVMTVKLPGRALHQADAKWTEVFGSQATRHRRWAGSPSLRRFRVSNWIFPSASLHLDLLLPSAGADRQIRVNLPDGISPDPSLPPARRAELDVRCVRPLPIEQLAKVTHQLVRAEADWPSPLYQSLSDLATAKADAAWATLRDHHVGAGPNEPPLGQAVATVRTRALRDRLTDLSTALGVISAQGQSDEARGRLATAWRGGRWLDEPIQRRTSTDTISPGVVAARAREIEDASQRSEPTSARMEVQIAVTDAAYYKTARLSGVINTVLMAVVLIFFRIGDGYSQTQVSAEVLALILTLFSAIQVGRIERPDRSTLRGLLVPDGTPLIVSSILPPVVLAVALAFSRSDLWSICWAIGCIAGQLLQLWLIWFVQRKALDRGLYSEADVQPDPGQVFYTDSPDYTHDHVLHSGWWRRTTAEAVTAGRAAYAYVVWQHRQSQTLDSLLVAAQPDVVAISHLTGQWPPEWLHRDPHSGRRFHLPRFDVVRHASAPDSAEPKPLPNGQPKPFPDGQPLPSGQPLRSGQQGDEAVSLLERPANVLALQRSGTSGQLLNFAVFRDKPQEGWASDSDEIVPVDLDPSLVAVADDTTSLIGVFIGFPPTDLARVRDHPITVMLELAEHHGLVVREIQLPFPAPDASYSDLQWARIQLNVRTDELDHAKLFLDKLRDLATANVLGIQARAEGLPRILDLGTVRRHRTPALAEANHNRLVLATDLDVVERSGLKRDEAATAQTWRVLALCADWRDGIEHQTLGGLDPDLRLAGLTSVILYGKSVMLLLGHHPAGQPGNDDEKLRKAVYLDRWQSRNALGAAMPNPLLRVHMRTPDRPGATLEVLKALHSAIEHVSPDALCPGDWNVWYARAVVKDGNVAHVQLTIMLPIDQEDPARKNPAHDWGQLETSRIERRALALLARQLADVRPAELLGSGHESPPDTIIRVDLVRMPTFDQPHLAGPASPE